MIKNNSATKSDLKILETNLRSEIREVEERVKETITNSEVKILGELQKMREDNAAHKFSHVRINEEIEELQSLTKQTS